jgi:RNA polymerase sigma factor (sigma-70 family)
MLSKQDFLFKKFEDFANSASFLQKEDEYQYIQSFQKNKNKEDIQKLLISHLRFIIKIAYQMQYYNFPLMDLCQEGIIGFIQAVNHFSEKFDVRLVTFAFPWIKASMLNYIKKNYSIIDCKSRINHLVPKVISIESISESFLSSSFSTERTLNRLILKKNRQLLNEKISILLSSLEGRNKDICIGRLLSDPVISLKELAKKYNISAERVRQIQANNLFILNKLLN